MSTRSLVGGLVEGGTHVVYVHNDGYPSGRLPVLRALIDRDGADTVLSTIVSAREGGWSYLSESPRESHLGHGRVVEGYGVAYTDAPNAVPILFPDKYEEDSWIEYVYLIQANGSVRWAETERGKPYVEWDWKVDVPEVQDAAQT